MRRWRYVHAVACPAGADSPTPGPGTDAPATGAPTDDGSANGLCLLTGEDWTEFNYVTAAEPDFTSDAPGTAICQYASGLFLDALDELTTLAGLVLARSSDLQ